MTLTEQGILNILDVAPHPIGAAALQFALLGDTPPEGLLSDQTLRQTLRLLDDLRYRKLVMIDEAPGWQRLVGDFPGVADAGRNDRFYASTRRFLEWTERVD